MELSNRELKIFYNLLDLKGWDKRCNPEELIFKRLCKELNRNRNEE